MSEIDYHAWPLIRRTVKTIWVKLLPSAKTKNRYNPMQLSRQDIVHCRFSVRWQSRVEIELIRSATILTVKEHLYNMTEIPTNFQKLEFKGAQLCGNATIHACGICITYRV